MKFELTILGSNAAVPANNRWLSAQVLNIQEQLFLIDCGEGTQFRMQEFQIRKNKIRNIFITHLHGDHIFGLAGLLTSMAMAGRTEGHYSSRYIDLNPILEEARSVFPNTVLGIDGQTYGVLLKR